MLVKPINLIHLLTIPSLPNSSKIDTPSSSSSVFLFGTRGRVSLPDILANAWELASKYIRNWKMRDCQKTWILRPKSDLKNPKATGFCFFGWEGGGWKVFFFQGIFQMFVENSFPGFQLLSWNPPKPNAPTPMGRTHKLHQIACHAPRNIVCSLVFGVYHLPPIAQF